MSRKQVVGLVLVLFVVSAVIIADLATAVRPEWPDPHQGDPIPERPGLDDPPFHREPFAPTFEARRDAFLTWVSEQETANTKSGVWSDIAKLALDPDHLLVDGTEVPLRGYPRFDNPYTRSAEFGTGQYRFEFDGRVLELGFEKGVRWTGTAASRMHVSQRSQTPCNAD